MVHIDVMTSLRSFLVTLLCSGLCCGQKTGPCATMQCSSGEVCKEQAILCLIKPCLNPVGECRNLLKAGMCPPSKPGLFGACQVPACYNDADCPANMKCCGECPRVCTVPTRKQGKCPAQPPGQGGKCIAYCTTDASCSGNQKCCGRCPAKCTDPKPEEKPGNCPGDASWPRQIGPCMKKCSIDGQCPGALKCCGGGNVRYCVQPLKDGICAQSNNVIQAPRCRFDFQCSGPQKCCAGVCSLPRSPA